MKRLCLALLLIGVALFAGGAGMRVYAQIVNCSHRIESVAGKRQVKHQHVGHIGGDQ